MKLLTEIEFHGTFTAPMVRVPMDAAPPFDFWTYFDSIPESDFEGHDCSEGSVDNAWTDATNHFQHVLISSKTTNVFMVIVLDLHSGMVHGHRLLDLNLEYSLSLHGD